MTYDLCYNWFPQGKLLLSGFGIGILALQVWMFIEAALVWRKAQGVLEPQLPPVPTVKEHLPSSTSAK